MIKNIGIIGSGISGLTLANLLKDKFRVSVFEKARGSSGRLSTRREAGFHFDHGAPFFSVRSSLFKEFLSPLIKKEVVAPWQAKYIEFENKVRGHP